MASTRKLDQDSPKETHMQVPEPPECPVCLEPYDAVSTVPRVISCGHSTCEACISQLPNPFASTIRCPSCTQLVKLPNSPLSLPKNIDLLRISSSLQGHIPKTRKVISQLPPLLAQNEGSDVPFIPNLWSTEFYFKWKNWVLPKNAVLVESNSKSDGIFSLCHGKILKGLENSCCRCVLRENEKVVLVKIGVFRDESEKEKEGSLCNNSCKFKYSYHAKVMKVLHFMRESDRNDVDLVLNASLRLTGVGKVYGFWCNEEDNSVYFVFEGFSGGLVKTMEELENGFMGKNEDKGENTTPMGGFGMIGMDICEVISNLHVEGLVVGCLGVSCFSLNHFGRAFVDFGEVLIVGRRVCKMISRTEDIGVILDTEPLHNYVFVSPEVFLQLLRREGVELGNGSFRYEVGYGSDVWSLACLFILLLVGKSFLDDMHGYYCSFLTAFSDKKGFDCGDLYAGWMEGVLCLLESCLGSEFLFLKDILSKCLDFDPGSRPVIIELWKCIRKLVVKPEFDLIFHLEEEMAREISGQFVVLGDLCQLVTKTEKTRKMADGLQEKKENGGKDVDHVEGTDGDVVEGIFSGNVKCIDLKGHLDCVTGLAIGGGFLFSSSHDKIVNVWSLQDFSHVHSFKGHEDRITAIVFVDGGEPLCISADKGGVICIWGAKNPLDPAPMKKLFEPKDWRYSGIHALAVSGTQYLYTGSGDKTIKEWSLQDHTLTCTMTGHKSAVSTLAVCNGVLYSGSWDGTVRLWSLSDHNPLTVLGEDVPGNLTSVLSLAADDNILIVAHEDGSVKIWHNDVLLKSREIHNGAVFSVCKIGKWLFSGGWDKTINVQELSGDGAQVDAVLTGTFSSNSVITSLLYFQGKLFLGQADRIVKVYYFEV